MVVSVFGNVSHVSDRSGQPDNDVQRHHKSEKRINVMEIMDSVLSNVQGLLLRCQTCKNLGLGSVSHFSDRSGQLEYDDHKHHRSH